MECKFGPSHTFWHYLQETQKSLIGNLYINALSDNEHKENENQRKNILSVFCVED